MRLKFGLCCGKPIRLLLTEIAGRSHVLRQLGSRLDQARPALAARALRQTAVDRGALLHIGDLAGLRERNPFGNSVKLLALDIGKRLDKGSLGFGGNSVPVAR